jgi:hypothetical protein
MIGFTIVNNHNTHDLTFYKASNRMAILRWASSSTEQQSIVCLAKVLTIKSIFLVQILALLLISYPAAANEPLPTNQPPSQPIICYKVAWESRDKGGFGLTAGQAVTLCSGATDATKVLMCYATAWAHPNDGGLGLTAGQAVTLCKTNSLQ